MTDVKNTILIVDDEVANINVLIHLLRNQYALHVAKSGSIALEMAKSHQPDLILLDIIMPEMDGFLVLKKLREDESTKDIPVIFVTGLSSVEDEEKGLALEVADYISKPFVPSIVKLRVSNQIRMVNYLRTIEHMSMTDALTNLNNRRSFNEKLQQEWHRAVREGSSISLIMLDVDYFKKYNDTHGHQQGDKVLQAISEVFAETIKRSMDFTARWGGEEFAILLPATDLDGAVKVAEEIRVAVGDKEILLPDGSVSKVTVSCGVNEIKPGQDSDIDRFISDADKALYAAKEQGRNRVITFQAD